MQCYPCLLYFNPRSHEGSDINASGRLAIRRYFNPRSHEGSDYRSFWTACRMSKFQSTLPRRERPYYAVYKSVVMIISIHAPTKGATQGGAINRILEVISIHAPTKGATQHIGGELSGISISIHAPTKGATGIYG